MMAKILLISPHPNGLFPRMPSAVLSLAGYLLERGIDVEIFDAQLEDIKNINYKDFDLIGFSIQFTGQQIKSALKIAKYLRLKGVKALFIWGGIHPTIAPEETIANEYVDIVVRSEGEETLYHLIQTLSTSRKLEDVPGITFKNGGRIISTPDREFIDLDSLPLLPYHLLKYPTKYSELNRKPTMVSIGTSRGCPFCCGFCYVEAVHKRKWRPMSPERVIKEIKHIKAVFSPDMIIANDDYMFANPKRIAQIANLIIQEGIDIKWCGSIRFDMAAKFPQEYWNLLISSGFCNPNFGGESGSTEILKLLNKRIDVEQMKATVRNLKSYDDIYPYSNYMFGLPGEKYEDIKTTFAIIDELSKENNRFYCGISIYTPYPKTPLYNKAIELGFSPPPSLEKWADYQYNDVSNLPWLKGHLKSIVRTSGLFTHFQFNQPFKLNIHIPKRNVFYVIAFILLSLSARLRWKYKFFWIPLEWRVYEIACRVLGIAER